eukprot:CAMPEP_0175926518 /NCGR_PEP_ID=MMETSP0108-20121206/16231_1 /TAXON_ID=195067 ORGANISM="Goniomonas pacifica, Strain CCMP1869" /NCGR_SAMPLE_ID=MMETSP0108 /ASSEMBLY_ACC=CAM_ASM_000204 /LENGTH=56 /DNA_ID=CAMNT_0017249759 /DNA_START=93 /DNA_END=264 /DNA_ORIENTATION=+
MILCITNDVLDSSFDGDGVQMTAFDEPDSSTTPDCPVSRSTWTACATAAAGISAPS